MADLEYSVGVNPKDGINGLKQLQTQVDKTSDTFGKLKSAVAGIAFGAIVKSSFEMANSIRDLSAALGISIQNVLGFSQAMIANGSTIDRARDGITDFVKNLGEAARGSSELQKAFIEVGVSLNDLRTLSETEILKKTIQGLADTDDNARRSAIGMKIFGESTKGVDLAGVNRDLDAFIAKNADYASAIDAAGVANQNFKNSFIVFQTELLKALKPLSEFAVTLTENRETIREAIETILQFAKVIGLLVVFTKVGKWVSAAGLALQRFSTNFVGLLSPIAAVKAGIANLRKELIAADYAKAANSVTALGQAKRKLGIVLGATIKGVGRLIPVLGQLYAAYELVSFGVEKLTGKDVGDWLDTWALSLEKFTKENFPELHKSINELGDTLGLAPSPLTQQAQQEQQKLIDAAKAKAEKLKQIEDARREIIVAQTEELKKQLQTYKDANAATIQNLQDELKLLNYKDEELDYQRKILDFQNKYKEEVKKLQNELAKLNEKPKENAHLIEGIKTALKDVTAEYNAQLPVVTELAAKIRDKAAALRQAEEAATKLAEEMQKVKEAELETASVINDIKQATKDARFEFEALNMDPLQKQIAEIERDIKSKVSSRVAELQQLLTQTSDPAAQAKIKQQIESINRAAKQAVKTQADLAKKSYEHQRSFTYGWAQAFREYKENATNTAKKVGEVFQKTTQGIEDMIVNFVKTGKFEWKNFVADMLETLLRSQLQQTIAKVFDITGLGSGGGLLDSIAGFFGGGSSGQRGQNQSSPLYVYDVSGGGFGGGSSFFGGSGSNGTIGSLSGPSTGGFFSSIGNTISNLVSDPIGTISSGISSVVGSIGSSIGGIVDTVSSIGSSIIGGIGDFFGGFFANGGTLPRGKFGIVGEAGPELISGPANITPLSGLGGSVTYNINAVDAASFKALVARDPGFIHAVAMKGASGIPGRR